MVKNVFDYLKYSALHHPDKVAFSDENTSITFSELLQKAYAVSSVIIKKFGAQKNRHIAVYMPRSVDSIVAFMGIICSGNFYCPLDTGSPLSRVFSILKSLQPCCVIYNSATQSFASECKQIATLSFEDSLQSSILPEAQNFFTEVLDCDPLYVLFTSGSTGLPKGVVISHKSVIDYAEWLSDTFQFNEETIFANQAPFFFDNSILDIYSTLKNAATTVIVPERFFTFHKNLFEFLNLHKVNTLFWVPSALISVANSDILSKTKLEFLQKVLFCGEVMPNKQLNIWRKFYPDVLYANLYGPTEITDVCTYYIVDRPFTDDESLPIGIPCRNTDILVLNEEGRLVSKDEVGELCVRGTCLSLGYYGDFEKSNKVFIQNPLNQSYRDLIYRTGDLVKYNELGELIYICRKDYQIKHQGHRIELGEIETAVSGLDMVLHNCAIYDEKAKAIVLFCVISSGISEKEVFQALRKSLPRYMLPSKILFVENFPMTPNGKIDRQTLKGWIQKS